MAMGMEVTVVVEADTKEGAAADLLVHHFDLAIGCVLPVRYIILPLDTNVSDVEQVDLQMSNINVYPNFVSIII
ncbi:hypothetical protein NQZ79_g2965 [Umbelopsis isabellina]|nr:hypothetical protein NQZ79_g2965 [Umbelopsis isabellina]